MSTEQGARLDAESAAWIFGCPLEAPGAPGMREAKALETLDRLAADATLHANLMPRTAAVVPKLLAQLRDEANTTDQLAKQVARDVMLVAEVIGMANSAYYRRGEAIVDLQQAIRSIGTIGLQSAIARSILKPVFQTRGGELAARCSVRLWEHTDRKAQLCAALARAELSDPFEGYLNALVHNAVWSVVLRAMDFLEAPQPWRFNADFVAQLALRRDRLFAAVAGQWNLTPSLSRVAADVARLGLARATSAPGRQLCTGDRLASLLCLPDHDNDAASRAEAWLEPLGEPVRECYQALRTAGQTLPA